jgi:type II secretion system protein F
MPKFLYKAKKSPTETVEGTVMADNRTAAIQKVSAMGLYIVGIDEYIKSEKTVEKDRNIFDPKIGLKEITEFSRQLSDLLESGLSVVKALDVLEGQADNKKLKEVIFDIKSYCMDGNSLSGAMKRHPAAFSNLYVSMIRSGEASGTLEEVMKRLADFSDRQMDTRSKVRAALAYPALMALVGAATIAVLFLFVIPRIMGMFDDMGQTLPLPTQLLVAMSGIIKDFWWLIAIAGVSVWMGFARAYKNKDGKKSIDAFKLKAPIFGDLMKKIEIARFSRTLGTLLGNGVPVLEALGIVSETVENAVIRDEVSRAREKVQEGSDLAAGFAGTKVLPPIVISMIAVGEQGGHIEKSLFKIADTYDRETDAAIKVMLSLLEPALILVLGSVVGFIVISMLLPIFEMNFLVG